jgi:hypothetical protein
LGCGRAHVGLSAALKKGCVYAGRALLGQARAPAPGVWGMAGRTLARAKGCRAVWAAWPRPGSEYWDGWVLAGALGPLPAYVQQSPRSGAVRNACRAVIRGMAGVLAHYWPKVNVGGRICGFGVYFGPIMMRFAAHSAHEAAFLGSWRPFGHLLHEMRHSWQRITKGRGFSGAKHYAGIWHIQSTCGFAMGVCQRRRMRSPKSSPFRDFVPK